MGSVWSSIRLAGWPLGFIVRAAEHGQPELASKTVSVIVGAEAGHDRLPSSAIAGIERIQEETARWPHLLHLVAGTGVDANDKGVRGLG